MRLSWMIQVDLKSKDRCPEKGQKRHRHRGEATGREAEGGRQPLPQGGWRHQKLEEAGRTLPGASRGQHSPAPSLT